MGLTGNVSPSRPQPMAVAAVEGDETHLREMMCHTGVPCSAPPFSKEPVMRRMLEIARVATMSVIAASLVTVSVAQPPERPEGPPDRGGTAEGPGGSREGRGPGGPRDGRAGPGSREGRMGPGGGGPGGPPSPERFVEHAMRFDADGDGKLDRDELTKFAEEIQRMRGGPGGSRGGPGGPGERGGPGGPGGERGGPGGGPGGRGERGERGPGPGGFGGPDGPGGERPQRPQRPE
jgi:hypothetical protein